MNLFAFPLKPFYSLCQSDRGPGWLSHIHCLCHLCHFFKCFVIIFGGFSSVSLGRHGSSSPCLGVQQLLHHPSSLWAKHKGGKISVSTVLEFLWNTEASVGQEVVSWKRQVSSAVLQQFCSLPLLALIETLRSCKGTEGLLVIPQICLQGSSFPAPPLTIRSWDVSTDSLVSAGTACQEKEVLWKKQGTNNAQQVTRCKQMMRWRKNSQVGLVLPRCVGAAGNGK